MGRRMGRRLRGNEKTEERQPSTAVQDINDTLRVLDDRRNLRIEVNMLPPFYYLAGEKAISVLDELGGILVNQGLENQVGSSTEYERFYLFDEKAGSTNGRPTTIVKTRTTLLPEYTRVGEDGTNKIIQLKTAESCVSAQLAVHNPIKVPSFVMLFGGGVPVYDRIRKALFEFSEKYSLIDDGNYRDYMKKFFDMDNWLTSKTN